MAGASLRRSVVVDRTAYRFSVVLPPDWSPGRSWPVVLFLHGAGERGDDGELQTRVGLGPALERDPERWPVLAVFPQCRPAVGWRGPMLRQALAALDAAAREFNGDAARQYLTGLSIGGFGSWRLALDRPQRFAALVPICGGLDASPDVLHQLGARAAVSPALAAARLLAHLPVWLFHGAEDTVIPVQESRRMAEALREAGGDVRYSELAGVGHNAWDAAYGDPALPAWLLRQRRPG